MKLIITRLIHLLIFQVVIHIISKYAKITGHAKIPIKVMDRIRKINLVLALCKKLFNILFLFYFDWLFKNVKLRFLIKYYKLML